MKALLNQEMTVSEMTVIRMILFQVSSVQVESDACRNLASAFRAEGLMGGSWRHCDRCDS